MDKNKETEAEKIAENESFMTSDINGDAPGDITAHEQNLPELDTDLKDSGKASDESVGENKKQKKHDKLKKSMDKDKKEKSAAPSTDVRAVMEKTAEYKKDDLEKELDNLADLFRTELEKAKTDSDDSSLSYDAGELIQQLDEAAGVETIPEEELCLCCGERRRDKSVSESYEYCSQCREAMRHYPIGIQSIFILLAVVAAAVFAVMSFSEYYTSYSTLNKARELFSSGNKTTALEYYDKAIKTFEAKDVNAKKPYLESAYLVYTIMPDGTTSMSDVISRTEKAISALESHFAFYSGDIEIRNRALLMKQTLDASYAVLSNEDYYSDATVNDESYDAINKELDALIGKTTTLKCIDTDSEGIVATYDEPLIHFTKYMVSYALKKYDDAYTNLKAIEESGESYIWLYGYELLLIDAQKGNLKAAEKTAELLYKNNTDNPSAYSGYSFLERMKGNNDKALSWAKRGLAIDDDNADLYRMEGISYIVSGDYKSAAEALKKGVSCDEYGIMYETYLVAATELGDEDLQAEIKEKLTGLEVELSDRMNDYLDGKLTAQKLFTEGTGDVE